MQWQAGLEDQLCIDELSRMWVQSLSGQQRGHEAKYLKLIRYFSGCPNLLLQLEHIQNSEVMSASGECK